MRSPSPPFPLLSNLNDKSMYLGVSLLIILVRKRGIREKDIQGPSYLVFHSTGVFLRLSSLHSNVLLDFFRYQFLCQEVLYIPLFFGIISKI